MDKEIVKACIKYKNHLFTGFDHGECFDNLLKEEQPKDMTELEQGFIDNELNFVDRKNAMEIANNAGQLKFNPVKETLISEDLHLDWLKKQDQKIADLEAKLDEKTRVAEGYSELFDKRQHENYEQFCEIQELKAKLAESEKFMRANGFKTWKEAQEALNGKFECIFDEKHELWKKIVAENAQLKNQLTEKEEYIKYNVPKFIEANEMMSKQLAEKDAEVKSWKDGTMVVKLGKLEEQLAEKEKECAVWERAYEYAIFECDFYKNHTQTTNEETMKRIEQLYEKILKRAKLLMEDK